jgi:hypothetical protein
MNAIAEKIHLIERITHSDEITLRMLDKLIHCLIDDERRRLAPLDENLKQFEQRYQMSTEDFQRRFNAGELGDAQDFFSMGCHCRHGCSTERKTRRGSRG